MNKTTDFIVIEKTPSIFIFFVYNSTNLVAF